MILPAAPVTSTRHARPALRALRALRGTGTAAGFVVALAVHAAGAAAETGAAPARAAQAAGVESAPARPGSGGEGSGSPSDFSPAEKLLFMSNQLGALKLPTTLRYSFSRRGSMEEPFDDEVSLAVRAMPGGGCCAGTGDFLRGPRKIVLPEVESAEGNPVLMYFLERDVREMQRLTKGSQSHFRKRIRMAIYGGAVMRDVRTSYRGRDIGAQEIVISPFLDDPNRPRFEKLARKEYRFVISPAVPGGVVSIGTRVEDAGTGRTPLLVEELLLDGAASSQPAT